MLDPFDNKLHIYETTSTPTNRFNKMFQAR